MQENPTWHNSDFKNEKCLLNSVYGQIFGGDAINYLDTKIIKWSKIKADEIASNIKLQKNSTVLDFGCGPCFIASAVKDKLKCKKLYCYDVNDDQLNYAKLKHGNKLDYIKYDEKLGVIGQVPNYSLDLVYAFAVFIHHDMYMFVETFEALEKKMKKGGYVYLQFLPGESFNPKCPVWREHYDLWKKNRNFWTMAMHHVSQEAVVRTANTYGFEEVELIGHSGVPNPSMVDHEYIPQQKYNGNILFRKK